MICSLAYRPAKSVKRIPVVFTHEEAMLVIGNLTGMYQLIAQLLYGSGLRISECPRLRVKDVDFGMNHIVVRDSKRQKDRVSILPDLLRQKPRPNRSYERRSRRPVGKWLNKPKPAKTIGSEVTAVN